MTDEYRLERFIDVQNPLYDRVCAELRAGKKRSHWMWFVFPQIAGLGHSEMAQRYAIASIDEAKAYLAHPVLGARLRECTALVNHIEGKSIEEIFGYPDDLKFHSSMTLFAETLFDETVFAETLSAEAAQDNSVFREALQKYFAGERDKATLQRLRGGA